VCVASVLVVLMLPKRTHAGLQVKTDDNRAGVARRRGASAR
jgi:hypothetical protein